MSNKLPKIGKLARPPKVPDTCCNGLIKWLRSMVNFIVFS
ncbi:Uncharacterised protein [Vibrio cholerae]|nr:Uncharacterised protein [Vibrio cholerae]